MKYHLINFRIVGKTGDGKSTFLDLILGFISPIKGEIFVGDMNLKNNENLNLWRNSIAHVPQEIYLSDNSIAENIAMTYKEKNIDYEKLRYAAKNYLHRRFYRIIKIWL